jgi:hypothetical protein
MGGGDVRVVDPVALDPCPGSWQPIGCHVHGLLRDPGAPRLALDSAEKTRRHLYGLGLMRLALVARAVKPPW